MTDYFIALDVHCEFSEMAVVTRTGKLVKRDRFSTTIPAIREALSSVRRTRRLTFEEGPMADWLSRELRDHVCELVVCDPRRNHLIARDGDKDDPIDALKLADLYRGGFLKEVHQPQSLKRSLLKQQVSLYHDRVRERVRQGNQLVGLFRRHGVFVKAANLVNDAAWREQLRQLPQVRTLEDGMQRVLDVFVLMVEQEESLRQELIGLARNEECIRRFQELPGIGWIRGVTFFAYIDTPWRFRSKSALWKYCGIGLERRHSGNGPVNIRLSRRGSRRLKNVLVGAAMSTIGQVDNPFVNKYQYDIEEEGITASVARRNVARCLASTMWSLWKTGQRYDPNRVAVPNNQAK